MPSDERVPQGAAARLLADADAVLVPGGFGIRGIEGKIAALRYARLNRVPALGLCLGLQCMVVEAARNLAGLAAANSTEFDPSTPHPVVATMADQMDVVAGERDMGGTMRLGLYPARLLPGSVAASAYGGAGRQRAASAPVRGGQRISGWAQRSRLRVLRDVAGRAAGGGR